MSSVSDVVVVTADELTSFVTELFAAAGLPRSDAELTATTLVEADLRGVTSHGTRAAPSYLQRIAAGGINPEPSIRVLREGPAYAQLDGDNGIGQVVAHRAMERAIGLAGTAGVGIVGVANSNHFGAAAAWVMMASAVGMIGLATTNGSGVNMVAYNGAEAVVGNSPIAFAVPSGEEPPIVLDMACGVVAAGKIAVAAMKGESIPLGWGLTSDGQPTTDPNQATLVVPLGPKGYGLAVILDVLCGPLQATLAACHKQGGRGADAPGNCGHFFMAIDLAAFTDPLEFRAEIDAQIRTIRASRPQPGVARVYLPGEIEWRQSQERQRGGIPLHPTHWQELLDAASRLGVTAGR